MARNDLQIPYDAILIDDDKLVHSTWKLVAAVVGKEFVGFYSIAEFGKHAHLLNKTCPVYLDIQLKDGIRGDVDGIAVYNLGFRTIILQTGMIETKHFPLPEWVSRVQLKESPWDDEARKLWKKQKLAKSRETVKKAALNERESAYFPKGNGSKKV